MRNKNQLKPFLAALEKLWSANPDWRFGQLAANICNAGLKEKGLDAKTDLFYIEDEVSKSGIEFLLEVEEKHLIEREKREKNNMLL